MSENLDLVRSIYADREGGDFSSIAWADRDIEFVIADGRDPGRWTGLAGLIEGWRQWLSALDGYITEVDAVREVDAERVLALVHGSGRGKTSRVSVETEFANVLNIQDGKLVRLSLYSSIDLGLADLGVEE